jgi:8-oxo-dGTP pyrophosphatase MutT (NUDIX family)
MITSSGTAKDGRRHIPSQNWEREWSDLVIVSPPLGAARVAIPNFIKALRSKIGTDLLQVPTVSVLAYDDHGQLLLVQDKGSGLWGAPSGILDPYELPADAAVRETWEEAGVFVELTHIIGVFAGEHFAGVYSNGDQLACVSTVFGTRSIRGTLCPDHEETSAARYFALSEIDSLPCYPYFQVILKTVSQRRPQVYFEPSTWQPIDA